jgi:hypothetical protein
LALESRADLGDAVEDHGVVSPSEPAATAMLPGEVAQRRADLDEREREILGLKFGIDRGCPRTLEEVCACSVSRASGSVRWMQKPQPSCATPRRGSTLSVEGNNRCGTGARSRW